MSYPNYTVSATHAWAHLLRTILKQGARDVNPRGQATQEVLHNSVAFPLELPVVVCPPRGLSYKFMAAEALWINSGSRAVDDIAPYNKHISQFSDDGFTFFGAYGPRVTAQLPYVVRKLAEDRDTRQAVLTIWQENPPATKDVPCTVALTFNVRNGYLNCHVFMRSSDAWLGVPYDFFNFSTVAIRVASAYANLTGEVLKLGHLYFTAVSSHLYAQHFEAAEECLAYLASSSDPYLAAVANPVPADFTEAAGYGKLVKSLVACRDLLEGDVPWVVRPPKEVSRG